MKTFTISNGNYGFSLIELLVVVAIIGILAAIALPNYSTARIKASLAVTQMEIKNLATSIEQSKLDRGLMLVDGVDGNMDWGKKRIIEKFNSVGLTPEGEARSMIEVFAALTSPVPYISKIPDDPFEPKHGIGFDVSSIGNFTIEDAYYYEDNDPGANGEVNGTEGSINVRYEPALAINEYLLRGWGPNSNYESSYGEELDFAYWSIPYDISNGVYSRGEIPYHSTHGFLKQKYVYSDQKK